MNANISTFRARTSIHLLQEAPVDTRTPLMRKLDIIQAQSERPRLKPLNETRDAHKWRKLQNGFLRLYRDHGPACRINDYEESI